MLTDGVEHVEQGRLDVDADTEDLLLSFTMPNSLGDGPDGKRSLKLCHRCGRVSTAQAHQVQMVTGQLFGHDLAKTVDHSPDVSIIP